jgi:hypothetical protein
MIAQANCRNYALKSSGSDTLSGGSDLITTQTSSFMNLSHNDARSKRGRSRL